MQSSSTESPGVASCDTFLTNPMLTTLLPQIGLLVGTCGTASGRGLTFHAARVGYLVVSESYGMAWYQLNITPVLNTVLILIVTSIAITDLSVCLFSQSLFRFITHKINFNLRSYGRVIYIFLWLPGAKYNILRGTPQAVCNVLFLANWCPLSACLGAPSSPPPPSYSKIDQILSIVIIAFYGNL